MFKFPPHPTSVSTLPGENRTNEICIEMNNKRQQTGDWSHKILITAVWGHELIVYLLTAVLPAISAVECTSASAREAIELLECETSDFIFPDLRSPTALTSIQSITSSGGYATADLSYYIQECGWAQEATGWNLDWSVAEQYWHW